MVRGEIGFVLQNPTIHRRSSPVKAKPLGGNTGGGRDGYTWVPHTVEIWFPGSEEQVRLLPLLLLRDRHSFSQLMVRYARC